MKLADFIISLRTRKEIQELFIKGKFKRFPFFSIKYRCLTRENILPLQILWAIPKKCGKACERNSIKRTSREAFLQVLKAYRGQILHAFKGTGKAQKFQIAFIPQKKFLYLSSQAKMNEIKTMLISIHLFETRQ